LRRFHLGAWHLANWPPLHLGDQYRPHPRTLSKSGTWHLYALALSHLDLGFLESYVTTWPNYVTRVQPEFQIHYIWFMEIEIEEDILKASIFLLLP